MNGELSQQMFEKCSNVKFHRNDSSGSWVFPRGQRDDSAKSDLAQFYKYTQEV